MAYIGSKPTYMQAKDREVFTFTSPSTGTTTFSGNDDAGRRLAYNTVSGATEVFVNGVMLNSADFTATSGTSIVLATGTFADDLVTVITYNVIPQSDTVSKTAGGTFQSNINVDGQIQINSQAGYGLTIEDANNNNNQIAGIYVDPTSDDYGSALVLKNSNTNQTITQIEGRSQASRNSFINNGGKFGIGTSSPSTRLHVAQEDTATYSSSAIQSDLTISRKNSSNTNEQTAGLTFEATGWEGITTGVATISAVQPSNTSSADLVFQNRSGGGYAENMRIRHAGAVTMPSQPAFLVEKENTQTNFGGTGGALLDWTYVHYNVGNHFNISADTFTAPVTGLYHFNAWTNARRQSADTLYWRLTVNSTATSGGWYFYDNPTTGTWRQVTMGVSVKLAANDVVRLYFFANDNSSYLDYSTSANAWNGYSGYLVG